MNYANDLKNMKKYVNYSNRGMNLEQDINDTNTYYRDNNLALIYKKPTPITITKVDYPRRSAAKIKEAFFTTPSTLDYNGVYKGKYIDFDVKECNSLTSFPLANIHNHQIECIKKVIEHQGISFIIIRITKQNKNYLLFGEDIIDFIKSNTRKSIPIEYIEEKGKLINIKYSPRLDYLKIIDNYLEERYGKIQ